MSLQERNSAMVELLTPEFLTRDPFYSWTPVITQGGVVAATVNYARREVQADHVTLRVKLTVTGAGAGNTIIVVGNIPAALAVTDFGADTCIGSFTIKDTGTARYCGSVEATTASNLQFMRDGGTDYVGRDPNFALAAGDVIAFTVTYERS